MAGNHYVILVHGTWGFKQDRSTAKKPPAWYAKGSDFRAQLSEALSGGSPAQTKWRLRTFTWPECDNKDIDRYRAGRKLAQKIARIRLLDPDSTIHFIAHSHGGNVVLEALSWWFGEINLAAWSAIDNALDQAKKRHDESIAAARDQGRPLGNAPSGWTPHEDWRTFLEEAVAHASLSARGRQWPVWNQAWPFKKSGWMKDLQRAALLVISRTDFAAIAELDLLSQCRPDASGWSGFVEKLREFGRTWDIAVFGSSGRVVERRISWVSNAAASASADQAVHGIGRLVFLGTPFLHKRWKVNRSRSADALERTGRVFRVLVGLALFVYVLSLLVALLGSLFVEGIRAWNPATWPWWVFALSVIFTSSGLPELARSIRERVFYDTNVSFDLGSKVLRRISKALTKTGRIPCLVVSAGLLDEALLGLSAEPLVRGVFRPQLRRWLGLPNLSKSRLTDSTEIEAPEPPRRGIDLSNYSGFGLMVRVLIRRAFRLVAYLPWQVLLQLWRWAIAPVVERTTTRIVRNVTQMYATGLGADELRGASMEVSERPRLDDSLEEHFWDLTWHSLDVAHFKVTYRKQERFAFLHPDGTMPADDDPDHTLYRSMKEQGVEDPRLLKTALVIDERVQEAVGATGLVHSTYYDDEPVILGAAHFLRVGTCAERRPPCDMCCTQ